MFLFGIINFALYFTIQTFITTGHYNLLTPVDMWIPLIPEFIWIYHSLFFVIIVSLIGLMKSKKLFFLTMGSFCIAMCVLSAFYILFPSYYPRELWPTTSNSKSAWLLSLTRLIDAPHNTLPSAHNTFAWLIAFSMFHTSCAKKHKWLLTTYFIWAALISVATLVLKQHYIVDVGSGILLAYMCHQFTHRVIAPRFKE
jgi:membrane-associated phospholipid phosphatase